MSLLNDLTTTAVDAVGTLRTKAAGVVVDVRKQLPVVEPKKVQSAVRDTAMSARKQVIDLTAPATKSIVDLTQRGEKLVRDIAGRPATVPAVKAATKNAAQTATKTAATARKTVASKTTAAKRTVKKAAPSPKS